MFEPGQRIDKRRGMVPSDQMAVKLGAADVGLDRGRAWRHGRARRAAICLALLTLACQPALDPQLAVRFAAACAELAAKAGSQGSAVVAGLDGWYFAADELERLGAIGDGAAGGDALSAVVSVHRQLQAAGTALLVVPVPPKSIVYADRLAADLEVPIPVPRLDHALQDRYTRLRDDGVDVLDLTRRFIRDRFHPEGPLYCRQDSRWSGTGCIVAAAAIGERVAATPALAGITARQFEPVWYSSPIRGDLWVALGAGGDPTRPRVRPAPEELRFRAIVQPTAGEWIAAATDPQSPIALVGDDHTLVFHAGGEHHVSGAGLADQLTWELGIPVALESTPTWDPGTNRDDAVDRAAELPSAQTRLVIWVFAATRLLD